MTVVDAGETPVRGGPPETRPSRNGGTRPAGLLRRLDVDELVAAERAAAAVSQPAAHFWRSLVAAAESAVSPDSLDHLFRQSLEALTRVLGVDTVAVLLANEAGDELVARAAIGLSEELTLELGIRAGEGMSGQVLATRRPLLVGDLSAVHVVNPVLRTSGLRSVVAVPLMGDEKPLGVMYAASYELERFTEADASLLGLLADRLAAALERVRLFGRERAARRDAERLAARIGRMQQVTALLGAVRTTEEAAAALVGSLLDEADGGSPWWAAVWRVEGHRLVPTHHGSTGAPLPPPVPTDLASDTAVAHAARRGVSVVRCGPHPQAQGADIPAGAAEPPFDAGAFVALPIPSPDGIVGVLALAYPGWRTFDDDTRDFLDAVVRQASVAFDRARLAEEQRQLAELAGFFAGAARTLAEATDLPGTLDRLADLALEALGEVCLIDMLDEERRPTRMVAKHRHPHGQPLVDRLRAEFPPDPLGAHPATEVLRTGITRWSDHMSLGFLRATTRHEAHFELTRALGFRSYMTVAIISGGEVMGTLTSVSTSRAFGPQDVALAEQLTRQVAALVENARRFDTAAHTSRVLQASLLPQSLPEVPGLAVDTRYLPAARALEVGGDFYDLYTLPDGRVSFVIGDVAGHDRGAAALMGHLRTGARAVSGRSASPDALIDALRDSWELLGFDRIATAVFGTLDPGTGSVALATAGHYPPLHLDEDGARFLPVPVAPPLGAPGSAARCWEGCLATGDILLLYTDGAIDERSRGSDASMAELASHVAAAERTPAAVCGAVVRGLPENREDDLALLAFGREPLFPDAATAADGPT